MWAPQDTHMLGCVNVKQMQGRWNTNNRCCLPQNTVKIEQSASVLRPVSLLSCTALGCGRTLKDLSPYGFRCRRSRARSVRHRHPVIPNFTSDFLVAPRNVQQGEALSLSRFFPPQADGDTQPLLAFGPHHSWFFVAHLVRDLNKHTHPAASMAQHNPIIEWSKRASPQRCFHRL